MIRTIIQLPEEVHQQLREKAYQEKISISAICREAIEKHLKEESPMTTQYRGLVVDGMKSLETKKTKWYPTYKEAHDAAEKLCKRTMGNRGSMDVETN